ncbi:uncharacterized protein K460DRAFT_341102 [Cucurbitaria berberidis CBS 394.84]|uniref:Uncharacterized protein n=1 Tax=Cucurbitaria berberidis CBS 394.84 TaxID=1168544 RepID=A0A9P4L5R4_9PLEO|nr:uncharacterized protein K460DRAFT_341102 [Cucurbitaria berberidis CBS 394.84]KAF1843216.1 hypothetical protein K460DRAFT_341102 [Cucurbitaria berberidis CBS 394.84]
MNTPPFALFVLDKDINNEYINKGLESAHGWDSMATWDLWVATDSYDDMPKQSGDRQPPPEATKPPLADSYKSPWVGKTIEECAKWLQAAPEDTAVLKDYFTAVNEFSKEDDTVLTCRVRVEDGDLKVDYYPLPTKEIAMMMLTNRGSYFDERGSAYQSVMRRNGKPDRSQGGPFH